MGLTLHCGSWASDWGSFSSRAQALCHTGSVVVVQGLSCFMALWSSWTRYWTCVPALAADSYPLYHQGSPTKEAFDFTMLLTSPSQFFNMYPFLYLYKCQNFAFFFWKLSLHSIIPRVFFRFHQLYTCSFVCVNKLFSEGSSKKQGNHESFGKSKVWCWPQWRLTPWVKSYQSKMG